MGLVWLAVLAPALLLAGLGILLWFGKRERRVTQSEIAEIEALSEPEAKALALKLLLRPGMFTTVRATGPLQHPTLPSGLVELFSEFEQIAAGEFGLSSTSLRPSARLDNFIRVGEDTMFTEILVKPGDSQVYVLCGEGPPEPPEVAPSIWHLLLLATGVNLAKMRSILEFGEFGDASPNSSAIE